MVEVEKTRVSVGVNEEGVHVWLNGKVALSFPHEDGRSVSLANQILTSFLEYSRNGNA